MLLVDRQLRDGLFRLNDIQAELKQSRLALLPLKKQRELLEQRIKKGENDLVKLEKDLIALRQGEVVITSGQSLGAFIIQLDDTTNIKKEIENIFRTANLNAFSRVMPGAPADRRLILIRKDHVEKMQSIISDRRKWVINIRSAGNVLLGEKYVYAFPEVLLNKNIVAKDEVIASNTLNSKEFTNDYLNNQIKLLLASTLAEVKRRGSLVSEIKVDTNSINSLSKKLRRTKFSQINLQAISGRKSDTAEKISVFLRLTKLNSENRSL
ncbi:Myosin heavy chain [Prochlorococcus sp. MIT 0601]|nr:Myosin heavy chain [Prochlorococcus sp. MIT 0601]